MTAATVSIAKVIDTDRFLALLGLDLNDMSEGYDTVLFDGGDPFLHCNAKFFDWSEHQNTAGGFTMQVGDGTYERYEQPLGLYLSPGDQYLLFGMLGRWLAGNRLAPDPAGLDELLTDLGLVDLHTVPGLIWAFGDDFATVGFDQERTFAWQWNLGEADVTVQVDTNHGDMIRLDVSVHHLVQLLATLGAYMIETG